MAYAAAFIIHTTPMLTELDAFSWWTISDICACDSLSLSSATLSEDAYSLPGCNGWDGS
jgi:hypothetical protein